MKRILIVAGDPSGDLLASKLVESLRILDPQIYISSIGGENLKKVSDQFLVNIVSQNAIGFAISPKQIFFFKNILDNVIIPELKKNKIDAVIPVDFYGFNSKVAQSAKKFGCKVFYYASPQFWASRPWRANRLRHFVDLFLCLFPFELDFYNKRKLPAEFVGHPLLDQIPDVSHCSYYMKVEPVIGMLPGSRKSEIVRHLPLMVEVANQVAKEYPGIRFLVFTVPHINRQLYHDIISGYGKSKALIELIQDVNYQWRTQLDLAMTSSGLETLENALLGIPMVVIYKMNLITYSIARALIQVPYVGMPNLLAGKKIVPEYIQSNATAKNVTKSLVYWIKNPHERKKLRDELLDLRLLFGNQGASERAAKAILGRVA
ncbi:MAG: lipid-A-disaccharide synthase [Elusimicrobiota bacterium]